MPGVAASETRRPSSRTCSSLRWATSRPACSSSRRTLTVAWTESTARPTLARALLTNGSSSEVTPSAVALSNQARRASASVSSNSSASVVPASNSWNWSVIWSVVLIAVRPPRSRCLTRGRQAGLSSACIVATRALLEHGNFLAKPSTRPGGGVSLRCRVRARDPAIHDERGGIDVARVVTGQEQGCPGDLLGPGKPSHWHVDEAPSGACRVLGEQLAEQRRVDRAGAERVDADAPTGELDPELP